jgi:hypothetical protein
VFVDSVDVYRGPPLMEPGIYTAVGFGNTTPPDPVGGGGTGGGIRRYRGSLSASWGSRLLGRSVLGGGDSGGPLLVSTSDGWRVVGVASNASSEDSAWANASLSIEWIESIVDPDGDGLPRASCRDEGSEVRVDTVAVDDPDGDYVPSSSDSCPSVYNPCQVGIDSDADSVPDDCDACPTDPGVAGPPWETLPDSEAVPDGVPDACDCTPLFHTPWIDRDFDGHRDECDNCGSIPNIDQANCDFPDIEGDACDDEDRDGVLDVCGALDNCVGDANPAVGEQQPNCNADAEEAVLAACLLTGTPEDCPRSEYVRGDACDPTPCGDTLFAGAAAAPGGRVATDVIRVDAIADVDAPTQARTGFRFCRCPDVSGADTPEEREACVLAITLPTGTVGGCDPLTAPLAYDNRLEEPDSWRWTTVSFTRVAAAPGALPGGLNAEARTDHVRRSDGVFEEDLVARWRFEEADIPRWTSGGDVIPTGPGAFLDGVLLTHQPGAPTGPPSWERLLSSHLESGTVRFPALPPPPARDCAPGYPVSFSNTLCPFCAASFPRPWAVGLCGSGLGGLIDVAGLRLDPSILGAPPLPDPPIDGGWLAPSEPLPALGRDSIRAVGFTAGPVVQRALVEVGSQLVDLYTPCQVPGQCDPLPLAARTAGAAAAPPILVLSGTRGELYTIDAEQLRAFDIRQEAWRDLASLPEPGRPLAATYDATREELIILDELSRRVGRRMIREARLKALSVSGQCAPRVLASFSRVTSNDRFALAVDVVGNLWVAAGLPVGRAHVLLELRREGDRVRTGGFRAGAGRLARGDVLRVDPLGATFLVEDSRLGVTAVGVRARELTRLPGATDRCF